MLLRGLTWLVLFQLLGTAINVLFLSMLPGPIIGMLLLFVFLLVNGEVGEPLSVAASGLLRYLPLLLVPAAVGVSHESRLARRLAGADSPSVVRRGHYPRRLSVGAGGL